MRSGTRTAAAGYFRQQYFGFRLSHTICCSPYVKISRMELAQKHTTWCVCTLVLIPMTKAVSLCRCGAALEVFAHNLENSIGLLYPLWDHITLTVKSYVISQPVKPDEKTVWCSDSLADRPKARITNKGKVSQRIQKSDDGLLFLR